MRAWVLALSLVASVASAQQPVRFVVMDDYIRDQLAADWDLHKNDPVILERGYCLGWQYDVWAGEVAYRVTQISSPAKVDASPIAIGFDCTGKYPGHLAELHVHPNQTCIRFGPCFANGPYAWQCQPSDRDKEWLQGKGEPFSMVQCSREATVYWLPLAVGAGPAP